MAAGCMKPTVALRRICMMSLGYGHGQTNRQTNEQTSAQTQITFTFWHVIVQIFDVNLLSSSIYSLLKPHIVYSPI